MMTKEQALATLAVYEERAKKEDDATYAKRFGNAWFSITFPPGWPSPVYEWGVNKVNKEIAIEVVRSFAQIAT